MSQRNAEQVSEAILKAVLRKSIDEQVIGDVSAQELVGLVANNFSSCPACGAEPWTNIDCRVCDLMGLFGSEPRVDPIAAERERCARICDEIAEKASEEYEHKCLRAPIKHMYERTNGEAIGASTCARWIRGEGC